VRVEDESGKGEGRASNGMESQVVLLHIGYATNYEVRIVLRSESRFMRFAMCNRSTWLEGCSIGGWLFTLSGEAGVESGEWRVWWVWDLVLVGNEI
jgi:hypothetical protein